jgi:hypothetical protein
MNTETKLGRKESCRSRELAKADAANRLDRTAVAAVTLVACLGVLIYSALADAPQPVLRISSLGSNQFSVVVSNGVSTTNYTLFWTPVLNDPDYPWQVLGIGEVGETNFFIDGETWPVGFFQVLLGTDSDGDGVPEWLDARPFNPNVGILSITIDSPTNGFSFN